MHTLRLTEFGPAQPLAEQLAESIGVELGTAAAMVAKAGERLRTQHKMKESPLRSLNGSYRAEGVAGVISLHENVDLQIVPKYASVDDGWAEDLLFLSLFAAYGRLDPLGSGPIDVRGAI